MQLITTDTDDYLQGGKNYYDSFWKITKTEVEGYYTLENRGYPRGMLTAFSKYGLLWKFLKLSSNPAKLPNYQAGKSEREKVLFKITQSEVPGYFRIQWKLSEGSLTWFSTAKTESGYFFGIDDSSEKKEWYSLGGRWQDDTLFSFTFLEQGTEQPDAPAQPKITGLMTNIYYTLTLKSKENSLLSFTQEGSTSYAQLVTSKNVQDYKAKDATLYTSTLWKLVPTDLEGYYLLQNKGAGTDSYMTTATKSGVSDKYLQILKTDPKTQTENLLWHVELTEERDFYRLKLKSSPNGVVTWKIGRASCRERV